jgi:hypothetical protein
MGQTSSQQDDDNYINYEELLKQHATNQAYTFSENETTKISIGIRTIITLFLQGILTSLTVLHASLSDCKIIKNGFRRCCSFYISYRANIMKVTFSATFVKIIRSILDTLRGHSSSFTIAIEPIVEGINSIYIEELQKYISEKDPSLLVEKDDDMIEESEETSNEQSESTVQTEQSESTEQPPIVNVSDENPILQ